MQSDFLKRFLTDPVWRSVKAEFDLLFGKPIWLNIAGIDGNIKNLLKKETGLNEDCIKKILDLFKKSARTKRFEKGSCCVNKTILSFPIFIEDKHYGYIGIVHLKKGISPSLIKLLRQFIKIFAVKMQKDLELERLYETIGPRTLALSTIHTLHRAMSSNLNLDELLPRIGRLSLQILGATVCKIYILDKKTNELVPKVDIDLKPIDYRSEKKYSASEIAAKVAGSALSVLEDDLIAVPLIAEEVLGIIIVSNRSIKKPFTYFDQDILSTLAEQGVIAIKNARLFEQQERLTLGSVRSISSLLKVKEGQWHSHTPAFRSMLSQIAMKLRLSKEENTALQNAALLHDIEKVSIPDKILQKNKPLTKKEYRIIEKHPLKTVKILKPLHPLEPAIPIILHHHERYDGKGYPSRLKGEQIPIGARIMAVVDAFEAMVTNRPWRKALSVKEAILEISRNSGTQFDPLIVEAFLRIVKDPKIIKKLKNKK